MPACSAYGCKNRTSKSIPGVTFHRFPCNEKQQSAWIKAIRRKDWAPTKHSRLCSHHFSEDVIDRTLNVVRLRENAVPTIFGSFPSNLKLVKQAMVLPEKQISVNSNNFPNVNSSTPQPPVTEKTVFISVPPTSTKELSCKNKKRLDEAMEREKNYKKKIKMLHQKTRRYKKKIDYLKSLLCDLQGKTSLGEILGVTSNANKVPQSYLHDAAYVRGTEDLIIIPVGSPDSDSELEEVGSSDCDSEPEEVSTDRDVPESAPMLGT